MVIEEKSLCVMLHAARAAAAGRNFGTKRFRLLFPKPVRKRRVRMNLHYIYKVKQSR